MAKHTIRKDNFDMMRSTASSFQPQPAPMTQPKNPRLKLEKVVDPILDHLKGIRDTTPPRRSKQIVPTKGKH